MSTSLDLFDGYSALGCEGWCTRCGFLGNPLTVSAEGIAPGRKPPSNASMFFVAMLAIAALLACFGLTGCTLDIHGPSQKCHLVSPEGMAVMIVADTSPDAVAALSPTQREILHPQKDVFIWCREKCHKTGEAPDFRNEDPTNPMDHDGAKWQAAIKGDHPPLPCIMAANGRKSLCETIAPDETPAALIAKLEKVKGK
jgi:hypothetical protein